MKQDGSALTRLEAAMLGLYLMGFSHIARDNNGDLGAFEKKPRFSMSYGEWLTSNGYLPLFEETKGLGELMESTKVGAPIEILPWLRSHGITPPEVEG